MVDTSSDTCTLDGVGPLPVLRPASVADLAAAVRQAAATGQALFPLGGRTHLHVGLPPERPGLALDLTALNAVLDYPARDMTVTVQAGVRLADLQRLLARENQRLPVDVPWPETATLGGALAVNASGPHRHGFGTLRDYVLGLSAVNDEGRETRSGGRVVKNVAGYDLHKLHIGALGTLGVITQVTLKLRPLPEVTTLLTLGCGDGDLAALLDALHVSRTRPVCLDVLNAAAARQVSDDTGLPLPEAPWLLVIGYEDSEEAVDWQVQQVLAELPPQRVRGLEARAGSACAPLWRALTDLTARPAPLSLKAVVPPAATASLCRSAAAAGGDALVQAHAGAGIVRAHWPATLTLERAQEMLKGLQAEAEAAGGSVTLPRCPTPWKSLLPVWGSPRPDWQLMRRVKESLDPRRLFNPGRFVAGI